MTWLLVIAIGLIVGSITNMVVRHLHMPLALNLGIGAIGAVVGATLFKLVNVEIFGVSTFYLSALLIAVCISAGSVLAYSLTFANKISR